MLFRILLLSLFFAPLAAAAPFERDPNCNSLGRLFHQATVLSLDLTDLRTAELAEAHANGKDYQPVFDALSALQTTNSALLALTKPFQAVCPTNDVLLQVWPQARALIKEGVTRRAGVFDALSVVYPGGAPAPLTPAGDAWANILSSYDSLFKSFFRFTPKPFEGGGGGRDDFGG